MAREWTDWETKPFGNFVSAGAEHVIPESFQIKARSGDLGAEVDAVVEGQRARAIMVIVTNSPRGVTAAALHSVPIREFVARGVAEILRRLEIQTGKDEQGKPIPVADAMKITEWSEADKSAAQRLVGYIDIAPEELR
jgi:hypothetical protein